MSDTYPAPDFHLPLREIFPDIWLASSQLTMSIPLRLKIRFSRNMVAVLQPEGWVLLNPVRLSADAEAQLLAKAPFKHAVRLGSFHGRDDRYYVERHGVQLWGAPGRHAYPEPAISQTIHEEGPLPLPNAQVVVFRGATRAECVVCLPQHQLLVTCDCVQHYENDPLISRLGKIVMSRLGFFTPCVIGPFWLKEVTPRGGSLREDFERILALDFDSLIAGHGTPKIGGAKQALRTNVERLS